MGSVIHLSPAEGVMDILARTVTARTGALARQIWASLSPQARLASVFIRLGFTQLEVFGRFVMSRFIARGVTELPDIDGRPALDLQEEMRRPRGDTKLPRHYGQDMGKLAYAVAMRTVKNPALVDEVISQVMVKMVEKKDQIHEGISYPQARQYVLTMVKTTGIDLLRSRRRRNDREDSMSGGPEGESGLEDGLSVGEGGFGDMADSLSRMDVQRILAQVESKLGAKSRDWLEKSMEGMTDVAIAETWGLPSVKPLYKWKETWVPKIQHAVRDFLEAA